MNWRDIQTDIAQCNECVSRWSGYISNPLTVGEIPDPPSQIRILFVGVAPTNLSGRNQGTHFYSSPTDNLRRALFTLLMDYFSIPLRTESLPENNAIFHSHGYFFVHAGKVRPVGQNAPPPEALTFCAHRHLETEIQYLAPLAICFLGMTNLRDVAASLFPRAITDLPTHTSIGNWIGWVALAPQPVRGNQERTQDVIEHLLRLTASSS